MKLLDLAIRERWSTLIERSYHKPHEISEQDEENDGLTVLHLACIHHQPVDVIRTLLQNNKRVEQQQQQQQQQQQSEVVITPAARLVNESGMTPLHFVCSFDYNDENDDINDTQTDVVRELVRAYPDVLCVKDAWGWTPLHCLCAGVGFVVEERVSHSSGGGVNNVENDGRYVPNHGNHNSEEEEEVLVSVVVQIAKILIQACPKAIHEKDSEGRTPLDLLCEGGSLDELLYEVLRSGIRDYTKEEEEEHCHCVVRNVMFCRGVSLRNFWLIVELIIQHSSGQCDDNNDDDDDNNYDKKETLTSSSLSNDGTCCDQKSSLLLHKVASMSNCPQQIIHLMTLLYPYQAHMKDISGKLPLHLAIRKSNTRDDDYGDDGNGIHQKSLWIKGGIRYILNVSPPGALETCCVDHIHYPFILARIISDNDVVGDTGESKSDDYRGIRLSSLNLVFQILRSKPELI